MAATKTAPAVPAPPAQKLAPVVLPELDWVPTSNTEPRSGVPVSHVVIHRWGVAYTSEGAEASSYEGVINCFKQRSFEASAHIVFPGTAVPGRATQMVPWDQAAWAEMAYNRSSDDIECADAIWLGHDPHGLAVLARIVAFRLHVRGLPAVYSAERGYCRHGDLGASGGGHYDCPVSSGSDPIWKAFEGLVAHETQRGGFRKSWGR